MRTRTLEMYWQGFSGWLAQQLAPRTFLPSTGRHRVLRDALVAAAVDVGQALVSERHGERPSADLALDRFVWTLDVATAAGAVRRQDADWANRAIETVRGLRRPRT